MGNCKVQVKRKYSTRKEIIILSLNYKDNNLNFFSKVTLNKLYCKSNNHHWSLPVENNYHFNLIKNISPIIVKSSRPLNHILTKHQLLMKIKMLENTTSQVLSQKMKIAVSTIYPLSFKMGKLISLFRILSLL